MEHVFNPDFNYKHRNPYHDKLGVFDDFVMRDSDPESFAGKWCESVFERSAPLHVEIGTGFGHFMHEYCQDHSEVNFVGLDYRFKRSFQLARRLSKIEHKNFRYLRARGERINFLFGPEEVDRLYYFFPDPWPKKRHNKKRLFQMPFLKACHQVLRSGGELWVKTDHDGYFDWMMTELQMVEFFELDLLTWNIHEEAPEHELAGYKTKFEKIFLRQGTPTKAIILRRP